MRLPASTLSIADILAAWPRWLRPSRRVRMTLGVVCALLLSLVSGIVYGASEAVPLPAQVPTSQASVIYYSDGVTELARVGVENRTDVPLSEVPEEVRNAVLAAEDRGFYQNRGVSPSGIARALWANASGKEKQGASTITQQYVKNAFLSQDQTMSRKMREVVLAVKVDQKFSKEQILEFYLNTIYFGRASYGIDAAAQTYFGLPVSRLTAEQGAVLAAVIKAPSGFDPAVNPEGAQDRWRYLLRTMADQGWLDRSRAEQARYPEVRRPGQTVRSLSGPNGYIVARVERELERRGISNQQLRTGSLRVVTTIDRKAQDAAVSSMRDGLAVQPAKNRGALVAVQPGTGRIRAYYGGNEAYGFLDYAEGSYPAGSTFKAYVLAAALGVGMDSATVIDGSSPMTVPGRGGTPLTNHDDISCPNCTLAESMVFSLNTPFYLLAYKFGPERIAELAHRAGIRRTDHGRRTLVDLPGELTPGRTRADIALGRYRVTPLDQAVGFATFAAGGVHADPFIVERAYQGTHEIYRAKQHTTRVFDVRTSAALTDVLSRVVGHLGGLAGGRAGAGKTGTVQYRSGNDNSDAWMVGYTPELAAAVWLGHDKPAPLRDKANRVIQGDGLPATIWRAYLDRALAGTPTATFPQDRDRIAACKRALERILPTPPPGGKPPSPIRCPGPAPDLPMPGTSPPVARTSEPQRG
jgi:membrane peptidoglycan carboxypeptidase